MLLNKNAPRQNSLSSFYGKAKQAFQISKTARFWFGALLTAAEQIQPTGILINITKAQFNELLFILNQAAADMFIFYQKSPPQEVYRLLHISRSVFDLNFQSAQMPSYNFRSIMHKVHFNNTLALFLMKNKQYAPAVQCFELVIQILKSEVVDSRTDIFLSTVSNFLLLLKFYQTVQSHRKVAELLIYLQNTYQSLLDKYIFNGCPESSLLLLLSVYKQHQVYLSKHFSAQNKLLIRKYEELHNQNKEYLNENMRIQHILFKNKSYRVGDMEVKRKQLNFFNLPVLNNGNNGVRKKNKLIMHERERSIVHQVDFTHKTISSEEKTQMNPSEMRRKEYLQNKVEKISKTIHVDRIINKTIDVSEFKPQNKPAPSKSIEKKQVPIEKRTKVFNKNESILVKVNYSILQVMADGIIISDFLKQKRRFLTWQEVFSIIKRLRYSSIFSNFLPVCGFYDVCRILSRFIYKGDSDERGAIVLDIPKELVQLNMPAKLYHIDGPYLMAFIMNQYDMNHVELCISCYFAEFNEYFKQISNDQYLERLNNKIFKKLEEEMKVLSMENWKRKQNTIQSLSVQFRSNQILDIPFLKSCPFRIVFYMPNNKQILIKYREKENKQEQSLESLELEVIGLHTEDKKINKLNIPLYKVHKYFSIEPNNYCNWLVKHGNYLLEGYEETFKDYPYSFNNLQHFNVVSYARKMQMAKLGKYVTPVTAQLIGSKSRIWGICIRFYELTNVKEQVTFIYNPYYSLLAPVLNLSRQECKNILLQLLFEGSILKTHKKLVDSKLIGSMVNIINFWNLIDF